MKGGDNMKKIFLIPVAAVALGATLLFRTGVVNAQEVQQNPSDTLVIKIAQKFGLNQSDVQAVFKEHHDEMHTQMLAKFEERLAQDVKDGKITEVQKQLIIAKHKEIKDQMLSHVQDVKNLSAEERKAAMQKQRTELEAWAKEHNIDMKYLFPKMKMKFNHKMDL